MRQRFARFVVAQPIDVGGLADRPLDRGAFPLDEVDRQAHRPEGQQQIGKENGGVDVDEIDRLQRDGDGELGMTADFQEGMAFPQRPVVGHVAPRLAHEPDRRRIDGLAPAGAKETVVHNDFRRREFWRAR